LAISPPPNAAGGGPVRPAHTTGAYVVPLPLDNGGQVPGPAGNGAPPAVRTAGPTSAPPAGTTSTTVARANPASQRAARRLEALMRQQAMIPGHLVKLGT